MAIPTNKKRYSLSLTPGRVERLQCLFKEVGLPASTLSSSVDDYLKEIADILDQAKSRGSFTLKDIFAVMGEQIEKITMEEKEHAEKLKEKEKAGKSS